MDDGGRLPKEHEEIVGFFLNIYKLVSLVSDKGKQCLLLFCYFFIFWKEQMVRWTIVHLLISQI